MSPFLAADWPDGPDDPARWSRPASTRRILGGDPATRGVPIPPGWVHTTVARVHDLRNVLRRSWVGLDMGAAGHLTDWVLAFLIARESGLLLGGPGVAKTDIAERTFSLLGLATPSVQDNSMPALPLESQDIAKWWLTREAEERNKQKYFSYTLSRFTEPEELFGPIEISLLRRGVQVRVNFGMITGPGVRAAFLDEIFKASSSILNSMLRLILNREHFNWGGMRPTDLLMFIGASNELPGGLGTGNMGVGASGEDFQTLYAFLDRFPVRLQVPAASGTSADSKPPESHLAEATKIAIDRETSRFSTGSPFAPVAWQGGEPSLNDLLLVGRAMMTPGALFPAHMMEPFTRRFYELAAALQQNGTGRGGAVTWTISPRKLKALWKIALAYAVVRDDGFGAGRPVVEGPLLGDLHVFDFIWDTPSARTRLQDRVESMVRA